MHIIRTFFYLLLACNLLLALLSGLSLAGVQTPWQTKGESERIKRQLAAEKIILIDAPVANTPPAPALPPVETQSPPVQASTPVAVAADTAVCANLKNLSADDVAQITALTAPLGDAVKQQSFGVQASSYWVNIPPGGGREGAVKRGEVLTRAGITDYIIVREAGPNQFAISLGLFRNEEAAKRLIDQLQKKNVKTARITVRDNTNSAARVELRGSAGSLNPLLDEIQTRLKTAQRDDCQPG